MFVETTNRGHGKTHISTVCKEVPQPQQRVALTVAIQRGAVGGCWLDASLPSGTTVMNTHDFLQSIINQLGQGVSNAHAFICDNVKCTAFVIWKQHEVVLLSSM